MICGFAENSFPRLISGKRSPRKRKLIEKSSRGSSEDVRLFKRFFEAIILLLTFTSHCDGICRALNRIKFLEPPPNRHLSFKRHLTVRSDVIPSSQWLPPLILLQNSRHNKFHVLHLQVFDLFERSPIMQ